MKSFYVYFQESFGDITKTKNDWVELSDPKVAPKAKNDRPLKRNIFELITYSYLKSLNEPHFGINSPYDVLDFNKYDYWEAIDIDNIPDADAVIFGKKLHGIKVSGIGHDGEQLSKRILIESLVNFLNNRRGYWIEASAPLSNVLLKKDTKYVRDKEMIQKMFPDSEFQWFEDGSYVRSLGNNNFTDREYIFGNPSI